MPNLIETVAWYELLYAVIMVATLGLNLWAHQDAKEDEALLLSRKLNGTRSIQVKGNIRNEKGRILRSLGGLALGIAFGLREQPATTPWVTYIALSIFFAQALNDLYLSIKDRLDRKEVLRLEEVKALKILNQAQRIEALSQELAVSKHETEESREETAISREQTVLATIATIQVHADISQAQQEAAHSEGKAERSEEHAQRAEQALHKQDDHNGIEEASDG